MKFKEPQEVLLLGPGPSPVHPRVLQAMSWNTLGHLDLEFMEIMNEASDLLRYVFETENQVTFPVSATGSAGMEAALVNILEPGDKAIVCVNGVFGARMADVASRCGVEVIKVEADWGNPIDPDAIEKELETHSKVKMVGIVQAETSTGVLQPLEPVVELARRYEALVVADTVTSLGGLSVGVDITGLDVVYSGTQKCISCPPGLAPLTLNERALSVIRARKTKVQSWYFDLTMLTRYWGEERFYHHTAPINMIYALYAALTLIKEEGLQERFARHLLSSKALISGLEALGLRMLISEPYRLPSLHTVMIPEGINDVDVRMRLRKNYNIEIGGGLGPFKGKLWRVGLMGHGSHRYNVERLLKALSEVLGSMGYKCSGQEAMSAVTQVYKKS